MAEYVLWFPNPPSPPLPAHGFRDQRVRVRSWQCAIGEVIAVLVSLFGFYGRYQYGSAGVLPTGLTASSSGTPVRSSEFFV
jgi:hypothetical protein